METLEQSVPLDAVIEAPNAAAPSAEEKLANFLLGMALLGVQTKYYASAMSILSLLIDLSPHLPVVRLMKAHLLYRVSDVFEGRHELLQLIEEFPEYHLAAAMLAMEDREAGVGGWRGLAESIATETMDPTSREMLRFVLRP